MKKILITGATGSIGRRIVQDLFAKSNKVITFSRNPKSAEEKIPKEAAVVKWNYSEPDEWKEHLNGSDAVIHLAGANLSGRRWNDEFKKIAYESRIVSTRNLVEVIKSVEQKPKVFICANAVGIYGNRYDEVLDENSETGNDFLAKLCNDWETELKRVENYGVRWVSLRTGLVLSKGEGLLQQLYLPFKFFVGGPLAGGKQWFPWIHIDDIAGIYCHSLDNESVQGPVNAVSPNIVRMKEFANKFGKALNRPSIFPIPKLAMKLVAGEVADYAVMSQRVSVEKILNAGYKFKFENLEEALKNILKSD